MELRWGIELVPLSVKRISMSREQFITRILTTGLIFFCTEYKLPEKNNFDRTGYKHHIWLENWLTDGKQRVTIDF